MEQTYTNLNELRDFVEIHNLMDSYSNIHFKAKFSIKTAKNEIMNKEAEVLITFDDTGRVTLIKDELDATLFPTVFYPRWQKMEHKENIYLLITGTHTKNPTIGKFEVKIVPLL
jgi:acyl-ACP thioesterase